jgi:hypothetical protein
MSNSTPPRKSRPAGIGNISAAIGYDVRDLLVEGYTMEQIDEVIDGKITLDDLFKQQPKKKPQR